MIPLRNLFATGVLVACMSELPVYAEPAAQNDAPFFNNPILRLAYLEGYTTASRYILQHPLSFGSMPLLAAPTNQRERARNRGYEEGWKQTAEAVIALHQHCLDVSEPKASKKP